MVVPIYRPSLRKDIWPQCRLIVPTCSLTNYRSPAKLSHVFQRTYGYGSCGAVSYRSMPARGSPRVTAREGGKGKGRTRKAVWGLGEGGGGGGGGGPAGEVALGPRQEWAETQAQSLICQLIGWWTRSELRIWRVAVVFSRRWPADCARPQPRRPFIL